MERIVIDNICQKYIGDNGEKIPVLQHINMTWNQKESIALMGESGSGKSTLARLIVGLEKPVKGHIFFNGEDTNPWKYNDWQHHRDRLQAVFQDASGTLNPKRSVYQNMEEALINLTNKSRKKRKDVLYELMEMTGISQTLLKSPVRLLSGGEQRRISLLRALVVHPRYLVLDEVTSGLDLISADCVLDTLELYREKFGCSYLFITHDWNHASRLSDRVLIIEKGKLKREAVPNIKKEGII